MKNEMKAFKKLYADWEKDPEALERFIYKTPNEKLGEFANENGFGFLNKDDLYRQLRDTFVVSRRIMREVKNENV